MIAATAETIARRTLLSWRRVFGGLLRRLVDLFRRQQDRQCARQSPACPDGQGCGGGRRRVGHIDNGYDIGLTEREIQAFDFSAHALDERLGRRPPLRSSLPPPPV